MPDAAMFEVVVDTVDEATVVALEKDLGALRPQRARPTREILTVLAITASVLSIIKTLLEIREKLKSEGRTLPVRLRNADRDEVELLSASAEAIEAFVKSSPLP
jgi:hypothetical protein